jgi:hypothetical protein
VLKSELSHIVNVSMTVDQIRHFVNRFAYEPWTSFFKLFEKHFGLDRLSGCMVFFQQNPGLIVSYPWVWMEAGSQLTSSQGKLTNSIKPLHQSYKSVYHPLLKDRFRDMPFMAKSSLSEMTARACDFATVCTEYRQVDYHIDRFEKANQLKQDNADEEEVRKQYQLCQKRLADLARAIQDYGITVDSSKRGQGACLPDLRVDEYRPDLSCTYDPRTYLPPPTALVVPATPTKKRKTAFGSDEDKMGSKRNRKDRES